MCFFLPLSTLIYQHSVQRQEHDPVTSVNNRPYDQNNLLRLWKGFSSLLDDSVDDPYKKDCEPNGDGNQADEIHHDSFSSRRPPACFVYRCYGEHFCRQQAGHVQHRIEWHEHHDDVAAETTGERRLDERHGLDDEEEEEDIPEPALVEELYRCGDEEEWEKPRDHRLIGHP